MTRRNARRGLLPPCLAAILLLPGAALAAGVEALLQSGRLGVESSLEPAGAVVPGQHVRLHLEVSTERWFTGGTRIRVPEVPGLVILQNEQFASNASEVRGGVTWVLQRWSLDVYPQRAGVFEIPRVRLEVTVNTPDDGDVSGRVYAPALRLEARVPPALAEIDRWVTSPDFTVTQRFDRDLDHLAVGDAFQRRVAFTATDVLAKMLPTLEPEKQPGLAAYPAPPVLDSQSNRGETRASRTEVIDYVVEAPGDYLLPARDYYWWDTDAGSLELLSLPAVQFSVAGAPAAVPDAQAPRERILLLLAAALLVAALAGLALRYLPGLPVSRLRAARDELAQGIKRLRSPALPERLNPGSSAGE